MKMLMVGWEFPPLNSGGLGTACYGLTKGLARSNVEVIVVLPRTTGSPKEDCMRILKAGYGKMKDISFRIIDSILKLYISSSRSVFEKPGLEKYEVDGFRWSDYSIPGYLPKEGLDRIKCYIRDVLNENGKEEGEV